MSTQDRTVTEQAEVLMNQGRYLEARALCEHALRLKSNLRLQQLYALALSKSGAPEEGRKFLEPVYQSNASDAETAGILGGIYKELFKKNQDSRFALLSRDTYAKNFEATKSYYTGINAAAMSAVGMQASRSKALAKEVITLIAESTNDFWELATLGEAFLLLKEKDKSIDAYTKAKKIAGSDWGKITSVYSQLWLLNNFIPVSAEIQRMFSPPGVMAFTGHMVDAAGSGRLRFPAAIEGDIKKAIANTIQTHNVKVGYCSLACGGDILFAEALAEQNGEVHIYIPFNIEEFIDISVRFAGEQWVERFKRLTERFPVNLLTPDAYLGHDELFALQSKIVFGAALIRSAAYHSNATLLTVLSEIDLRRLSGGTRDTLRFWPLGNGRININPDAYITPEMAGSRTEEGPSTERRQGAVDRPTVYLLSADASEVHQLESDKLMASIRATIESEPVMFPAFRIENKKVFVACNADAVLVNVITLFKSLIALGRKIKIVLHTGPVKKTESFIEGGTVDILRAMEEYAPAATISASNPVAALLALHPTIFSVGYSGFFKHEDLEHPVFKIEWK
jgi:tetratricopeptide (TPR) repeat protein